VDYYVFAYWWLIFPIMGMLFGAFGMWMAYRRQRDAMEMMRDYAAQGKDPNELARAFNQTGPGPWGAGPWGRWGYMGHWGYWGPYREWRRALVFGCLSAGFAIAAWYYPENHRPFVLVATILGVIAAASFVFAVIATIISANLNKNGK
jgi:hypothetical protein